VIQIEGQRGSRGSRTLAFDATGSRLAVVAADHTVTVREIASGAACFSLKGHAGPVNVVVSSPCGRRLATGGMDGTVKLWEMTAGKEVFSIDSSGSVQCLAFSADGQRLFCGGAEGTVVMDGSC
jgi:WD40 repeat protein